MRTKAGALIAILVIGLTSGLVLHSLPGAATARAAAALPATTNVSPAQAVPISYQQEPSDARGTAMAQPSAAQTPVVVNCGVGQQTLVRQVWLDGQAVSQVECVQGAGSDQIYRNAQVQPVAVTRVIDAEPLVVRQPRVVQARSSVYRPSTRVSRQPRRSWQKTALVIGGSTAAGAGIGGIIGGKKGALIGAAIGGGGSTLVEALKR